MFTKREVFTETFLPRELPGRRAELEALKSLLVPVIRGQPANSCWELGPSGVGKTTTARWLLEDLRANHVVNWTHVECVGSTRWDLLGDLCAEHPKVPHHQGMGTAEMVVKLQQGVTRPYIVILDEFDGLEDEELLVDLAEVEMLSVICIGHDEESALACVPDEVDGLRHSQIIEFEPYDVDSLLKILEARVETGLEKGVVDADQLHRIAEEAAGSARYGVQSLRSAVELGLEQGHTSVQEGDVDDCFEDAKSRIREQLLASLSRQHHVLYQIIREAGEDGIGPGNLLAEYRKRSKNPRTRQQVGNYRDKLVQYDLIETAGSGRWARYRAIDDTLNAPLRKSA